MKPPSTAELRALIKEQASDRHVALAMAGAHRRGVVRSGDDRAYWRNEARKAAICEGALRQWLVRVEARGA